MKSIILILPYFGKWPVWFKAYLVSIENNPTINWLCPTDCEIPEQYPLNITFLPISLNNINREINKILDLKVPLNVRKFCDIRPAFGVVFQEYIREYDFWGFCDMDIIWGDVRNFITNDILSKYQVITTRKEKIAGHFTLIRNSQYNNNLYRKIPNINNLLEDAQHYWLDEKAFTKLLKNNSSSSFQIYWPQYLVNNKNGRAHQEYFLDRWRYEAGKLYQIINGKRKEHMYLHFINWKNTVIDCEVDYPSQTDSFYISYYSIHFNKHTKIQLIANSIKNFFNGYHAKNRRWGITARLKTALKI